MSLLGLASDIMMYEKKRGNKEAGCNSDCRGGNVRAGLSLFEHLDVHFVRARPGHAIQPSASRHPANPLLPPFIQRNCLCIFGGVPRCLKMRFILFTLPRHPAFVPPSWGGLYVRKLAHARLTRELPSSPLPRDPRRPITAVMVSGQSNV